MIPVENVLTIDLEEWFHANYEEELFDNNRHYEVRVIKNTLRLLELFDRSGNKGTFFSLGYVAEKHPELLIEIAARGHEIATHGFSHQLVYKQTPEQFEEDLRKSIEAIKTAVGKPPKGYRAPSWSISRETKWALPILKKNGIDYDASIFPVKTFLYGIPDAPRFPFKIDLGNASILEFPTSTFRLMGKNIPFSGGFYFRFLPYPLIKRMFVTMNNLKQSVIFYLHPREIDPEQPNLQGLRPRDKFIHYYGINSCEQKLIKLLNDFKFITLSQYFEKTAQHLLNEGVV